MRDENSKSQFDVYFFIALYFLGLIFILIFFMMFMAPKSFIGPNDLNEIREIRRENMRTDYRNLIKSAVEYSCEEDVKCFKTAFCNIRKSGDQTVVYDFVSKQKLATFDHKVLSMDQSGGIQIGSFCTGGNGVK